MKSSESGSVLVPIELIAGRIFLIRDQKIMLDSDLAELYQVPTKALNQAVQRNLDRFPSDFMFQLNKEELADWRSQIVTSNPSAKMGIRRPPYAFTEHGVAMLSSVLKSQRAVQVNIFIIRAFIRLRELLASNKELANRLEQMEAALDQHASVINVLAEEINNLKTPLSEPIPLKQRIGFHIGGD